MLAALPGGGGVLESGGAPRRHVLSAGLGHGDAQSDLGVTAESSGRKQGGWEAPAWLGLYLAALLAGRLHRAAPWLSHVTFLTPKPHSPLLL